MVATSTRVGRHYRRPASAVTPKEFCRALWEQRRASAEPTTPAGVRTLQLGILLNHFIRLDPSPEAFEVGLEEVVGDARIRRAMLRTAARQVLRLWRSRRWRRAADGRIEIGDRAHRPLPMALRNAS